MARKRTINELRQVKDSVYTAPTGHTRPPLTEIEQNLLNDLNYKAKLILDIEAMFKSNKIPVDSQRLYDFDTKQLESILLVWQKN
jgi:hypothetical protein